MKTMIYTFLAAIAGFLVNLLVGPPTFRARTCDVAFGFRMGVGFPGDVNRMHPASIVPGLLDSVNTFRAYGEPAIFGSANNYRGVIPADGSVTAIKIAGCLVRPYPTQQMSGGMTTAIGSVAPPTSGVADFMHAGFMTVKAKAGVTFKKGDPVYVWCAATAGANIQGEYNNVASSTNTVQITNARFNGPADASGNAEIEVWQQA